MCACGLVRKGTLSSRVTSSTVVGGAGNFASLPLSDGFDAISFLKYRAAADCTDVRQIEFHLKGNQSKDFYLLLNESNFIVI